MAEPSLSLLDVRAQVEFLQGSLLGAYNSPLLKDDEREQVGTLYKESGQDKAIELGLALVGPQQSQRITAWKAHLESQTHPILFCWRGGMRSQIVQHWLAQVGQTTLRVEGGFKAIRRSLLDTLEQPFTGFVLGGLTGSGKTDFLHSLAKSTKKFSRSFIDLEKHADHLGSAFGKHPIREQPSQLQFENNLALDLYQKRKSNPAFQFLFEDESRSIGRVSLPPTFYNNLSSLPLVIVEVPLAERVETIFKGYVVHLISQVGAPAAKAKLLQSTLGISRKLGGLNTNIVTNLINDAFEYPQNDSNFSRLHQEWIHALLNEYYDPMYRYSMNKKSRKIAFQGTRLQVREFLFSQYS